MGVIIGMAGIALGSFALEMILKSVSKVDEAQICSAVAKCALIGTGVGMFVKAMAQIRGLGK